MRNRRESVASPTAPSRTGANPTRHWLSDRHHRRQAPRFQMFTLPQEIPKEAVHLRSAPPWAIRAALHCELRVEKQSKCADSFPSSTTREHVSALCIGKPPPAPPIASRLIGFLTGRRQVQLLIHLETDSLPCAWVLRRYLYLGGAPPGRPSSHLSILWSDRQFNCCCLHHARPPPFFFMSVNVELLRLAALVRRWRLAEADQLANTPLAPVPAS